MTESTEAKALNPSPVNANNISSMVAAAASTTCYPPLEPDTNNDTVHVKTILGTRLINNPFSLANMQQASRNLYGNANGITAANKKYVRFKPSSEDQIDQLYRLGLSLFDYPLDYEVTQQGDYYDQGLPAGEIPWYYTVVDAAFTPPTGIQYELLANQYIPADNVYLENEAFRITGNPIEPLDCGGTVASTATNDTKKMTIQPRVPQCPTDQHWDYTLNQCVPNNCASGTHWDGTQCVPDATTPTTPPVTTQPVGQIRVYDNAIGQLVPVRRTRILLKRWFKIDLAITDDNGNFSSAKHFRKVDVSVIFANGSFHVRGLRGARFYQMWLPLTHGIGKWSGNLNAVHYEFTEGTGINTRMYRNWWGAQLMNAYVEYNEMANSAALQTGTLPTDMVILLNNWGSGAGGSGSTPMNHKRINNAIIPRDFVSFYVADPLRSHAVPVFNYIVQGTFLNKVDMTLGYNVLSAWTSDRVKALMYHELSHAAHYNKVGASWWNSFDYAEETTIVRWTGANDPYGDGTDGTASQYISLAESWAEHMARTMCDIKYTTNSKPVYSRQGTYTNGSVPGLTSHLSYLEAYNPTNTSSNPFRWIPEGIYYDLIDLTNEVFPIIDGVSNSTTQYTNQQIFNALDVDVTSMPQFKQRLLTENSNRQATEVNQLFISYGF